MIGYGIISTLIKTSAAPVAREIGSRAAAAARNIADDLPVGGMGGMRGFGRQADDALPTGWAGQSADDAVDYGLSPAQMENIQWRSQLNNARRASEQGGFSGGALTDDMVVGSPFGTFGRDLNRNLDRVGDAIRSQPGFQQRSRGQVMLDNTNFRQALGTNRGNAAARRMPAAAEEQAKRGVNPYLVGAGILGGGAAIGGGAVALNQRAKRNRERMLGE